MPERRAPGADFPTNEPPPTPWPVTRVPVIQSTSTTQTWVYLPPAWGALTVSTNTTNR